MAKYNKFILKKYKKLKQGRFQLNKRLGILFKN